LVAVQGLVGANLATKFTTFLTKSLGGRLLLCYLARLFARNDYRILDLLGSLGLLLGKRDT